jgi:hypothetical protein
VVGKGLHSDLISYSDDSKRYFDNLTNSNYLRSGPGKSVAHYGLNYHWTTLIRDYSARDFTNFEDRLPEIAGIAKIFSLIWKDDYVAGLWRGHLINQLGWRRGRRTWDFWTIGREQHQFEPFPHIKDRTGWPSWSWKSVPFAVDFGYVKDPVARVIGYNVKLVSSEAPLGVS